METQDLIRVENLKKKYGDFTALKGISFRVQRGEIVGFLGPNGAGKTTTMKIITGYIPATDGTVEIDGMSSFSQSLACRRKIGYLPEDVPLYNDMKVTAYLRYVCQLRDIPKADIAFRIDKMVEDCNLAPVKTKLIRQLSKGNRQRVGLAQALIHAPEILVLDEPTVGLDPKQVVNIRDLIKTLGKEHTVILSTHILSEVEHMCDRVLIINEGRIALDRSLTDGSGEEARNLRLTIAGPAEEVAVGLAAFGEVTDSHPEGEAQVITLKLKRDTDPAAVARAVVNKDWALIEMRHLRADLEAVFLDVTMQRNFDEGEQE